MSCPRETCKRSRTISFWVTPAQAAEINEMVKISGLTKQDYLTRRMLDQQVIIGPSSRVVRNLKDKSERIATKLDEIANASQMSDTLLDELRWLADIMAAFARYGEEDFDAVERIINLERECPSSASCRIMSPHSCSFAE